MIYLNKYGWTLRDNNLRHYYKGFEIKKLILKSLSSTSEYDFNYRIYFSKKFNNFSKKSSLSFYRKSCMIRKCGRVIFKDLKLGRHVSKLYASIGLLVGFRKSSF